MGTRHAGLDVDGVISQPPQLQCLVQRAHHKQGIMWAWKEGTAFMSKVYWALCVKFMSKVYWALCGKFAHLTIEILLLDQIW